MNSPIAALGKNLVLIAILMVTVLNFFNGLLRWDDLLIIQAVCGLVYIFLSCYEYNNASYKAQLPVERFAYFPNEFFMFRAFKICAFLIVSIVLLWAAPPLKYLYPFCFIIAFTEIVVGALKIYKKLCYVSIYANYIFIVKEKVVKIFVSEIENVEYRHDIIYLVKKDRKTEVVKLFSISHPKVFLKKINEWITHNNVVMSAESSARLNEALRAEEIKSEI